MIGGKLMNLKTNQKARTFPFDNNEWNEFKMECRKNGIKLQHAVSVAIGEYTRKLRRSRIDAEEKARRV